MCTLPLLCIIYNHDAGAEVNYRFTSKSQILIAQSTQRSHLLFVNLYKWDRTGLKGPLVKRSKLHFKNK